MKKVTYYVANDGTKFDDEAECKEYEMEKERKEFDNSIFFFVFDESNGKMKRLSFDNYGFQDAQFLYIAKDEALSYFREQADNYGYYSDGVSNTGWYYYSYEYNEWRVLQELIHMIDCVKPYIAETLSAKNTDSVSW